MGTKIAIWCGSCSSRQCFTGSSAFCRHGGWESLLYYLIEEFALLPLRMTAGIVITALILTLGMCLLSGILVMRRVLEADPAEVF